MPDKRGKNSSKLYDPSSEEPFYIGNGWKPDFTKTKKKAKGKRILWNVRKKQGEGFWQGEIE